jgi:superfamily I DNA/RNA helicase
LTKTLQSRRVERRSEVRVRLRIPLKLCGRDVSGEQFANFTATENVSKSGFLCGCNAALEEGLLVEVALTGAKEELIGTAKVVRSEWGDTPYPRYGFRFVEKVGNWVLD